jgi:hypothetical protein
MAIGPMSACSLPRSQEPAHQAPALPAQVKAAAMPWSEPAAQTAKRADFSRRRRVGNLGKICSCCRSLWRHNRRSRLHHHLYHFCDGQRCRIAEQSFDQRSDSGGHGLCACKPDACRVPRKPMRQMPMQVISMAPGVSVALGNVPAGETRTVTFQVTSNEQHHETL